MPGTGFSCAILSACIYRRAFRSVVPLSPDSSNEASQAIVKRATINPRRGNAPNDDNDDERNPTKGNESNLLNIACGKVNDTNTGTIAVPDLRWLPVDEYRATPTYQRRIPHGQIRALEKKKNRRWKISSNRNWIHQLIGYIWWRTE